MQPCRKDTVGLSEGIQYSSKAFLAQEGHLQDRGSRAQASC
jgi:hypothetical protein